MILSPQWRHTIIVFMERLITGTIRAETSHVHPDVMKYETFCKYFGAARALEAVSSSYRSENCMRI
ncbi:hypothetical protein Plhal304r1_c011g0042141 [Plasmopara halstedii]